MSNKEWKFMSKEAYEEALKQFLKEVNANKPLDEESYDALLEEYIDFCASEEI